MKEMIESTIMLNISTINWKERWPNINVTIIHKNCSFLFHLKISQAIIIRTD